MISVPGDATRDTSSNNDIISQSQACGATTTMTGDFSVENAIQLETEGDDSIINMSFDNESKASSVSTLPAPSSMTSLHSTASSKGGATLEMERLQELVTNLLTHEYGSEFSTPLNLADFPGYDPEESKYHPSDLGSILR